MLIRLTKGITFKGKKFKSGTILQAEHIEKGVVKAKAGFRLGFLSYVPHIDPQELETAVAQLLVDEKRSIDEGKS